ncbi:MAG: ABC transporter substrate-binding protein [Actinomycetota bacterium]
MRAARGRTARPVAVAVLATALAAACAGGDPELDLGVPGPLVVANRGGELTLAVERMVSPGWTPSRSPCDHSCELVVSAVIDPIAVFDDTDEPVPHLVAAIEPVIDVGEGAVPFGSWDLVMRPDRITFPDGTRLTPSILAANLLAHRAPDALAAGAVPLHSVEIVDPTTVRVHFAEDGGVAGSSAWVEFPAALTGPLGWIVHPDDLVDPIDRLPRGTGPFVAAAATSTSLRLERREDHWRSGADGAALPMVDAIEVEVSPSEAVRRRRVEIDNLDLAIASEPLRRGDLEEVPATTAVPAPVDGLLVGPSPDVLALVLNSASTDSLGAANPWADEANRLALLGCLDPAGLVRELPEQAEPATGLFPPGVPGHVADPALTPPDALDAAAHLRGLGVSGVRVVSGPEDGAQELVDELARQLGQGCDVDVVSLGLASVELDQAIERGEFDLVLLRLSGGQDPDTQFARWSSGSVVAVDDSGANVGRVVDERVDAALGLIRTVPDPAVRTAAAIELGRALSESGRALWLAWFAPAVAVGDGLVGLGADRTAEGVPLRHPTFGAFSLATVGSAAAVPPP